MNLADAIAHADRPDREDDIYDREVASLADDEEAYRNDPIGRPFSPIGKSWIDYGLLFRGTDRRRYPTMSACLTQVREGTAAAASLSFPNCPELCKAIQADTNIPMIVQAEDWDYVPSNKIRSSLQAFARWNRILDAYYQVLPPIHSDTVVTSDVPR